MGSIIHFEIPTENATKSINFYQKVFKWKFEKWGKEEFWLIKTGKKSKRIDGGLLKKNKFQKMVINTIEVKNLDKTIDKIVKHDGEILIQKSTINGLGYLVYFKDPDQNVFGALQLDKKAK